MRLIDADEIIKQFDPNTWQGEMMIAIAKGLPTAYDVDKVVERLEMEAIICNVGNGKCIWAEQNQIGCEECVKRSAIKIVKGGGVDE